MGFVNSAEGSFTTTSTPTCPVPSGATSGQIAVATLFSTANVSISTLPSGFTELAATTFNTTTGKTGILRRARKVLSAADTGSYSFTLSGSNGGGVIWVGLWSGRDSSASQFDFDVVHLDSGTTQPTAISGVASAGSDVLYSFSDFNGGTAVTVPGFTPRLNDTTLGMHLFTADAVVAGTITAQSSATAANQWWTSLLSIKAAPTGPPVGWPGEAWS